MRRWAVPSLLLSLLAVAWAVPAAAVEPAITVQKLAIDIAVGADGRATTTVHREESPANLAAASQIGQLAVDFNPSLERLDILQAYTQKRDGQRRDVETAGIRAQLAPGVPNVPIFQDVQQKVVVFPDLSAGDSEFISYRKQTEKQLFPGQFIWSFDFDRTIAWDDVSITITAPASLPLHTQSFGIAFQQSEQDGQIHYVWHYKAPDVIAEDLNVVSPWDRLPRLFVSSFPDYAAFGQAYARMSDPKEAVTPRIQREADRITAGIDDRREQARAIYDWVSTHIRYVALYISAGGVVPHAAQSVLENGYGDCKDHVVLFDALLKAKGIESRPVLINLDTAYTLGAPPTLAQLDHVISYLPEFDLYADTTTGVAEFGTLPFQEYGKPAVLASTGADAGLRQIPMLSADAATIAVRTEAHIDLDGAIIGATTTKATGPAATALRLLARWVQTVGEEGGARRQLMSLRESGTGSFGFKPPDESLGASYMVSGKFNLDPQPELLDGNSFSPPLGLQLMVRPGDYFLGRLTRLTLPDTEPTPCFPVRQTEDLSLELPQGRVPQRLPADRRIATDWFTYRSHWSMDGQIVSVHREFVSRIAHPECVGVQRRQAAAALKEIRRDEVEEVALAVQ